jgi:histidinol-phosphate/aromatic aminotransferase/cobyric acid decarboxylase-like protein
METRRGFAARLGLGAAAARLLPEMAYAQRAAVSLGELPKEMVWLNANENPDGPPEAALAAMRETLPTAGRYHFQAFRGFYEALARSENLARDQVLVGAGSSEMLEFAVVVFTGPDRPLITAASTYEGPVELARSIGRRVVATPLREDYSIDVKKLAEEAARAGGGLIYLCNPNNPTASATMGPELRWLVDNLPRNTVLLVDEAYIHFAGAGVESALPAVRAGKDVIVTRTFSKIWGMAGLRAGFACARPDLIDRMAPYRLGVISIVTARAIEAVLPGAREILAARRAALLKTRGELCAWLKERKLRYIEPHANFVMIDVGRPAMDFITAMPRLGVAPGRPFPPLDNMLRVSIGTDRDMQRFRDVFWKVYRA